MTNDLFMLFDRVGQCYIGSLMIINNEKVARRSLASMCKSPQFPYKDFVDDLQLYKLGSIDLVLGKIEPCCEFICNISDLGGVDGKD